MVRVICSALLLKGNNVGNRYIVKDVQDSKEKTILVLDFSSSLVKLEYLLKEYLKSMVYSIEVGKEISGSVKGEKFVTSDGSEKLSVEVISEEQLNSLVENSFIKYNKRLSKKERLKNTYNLYCKTIINILNKNGAKVENCCLFRYTHAPVIGIQYLGGKEKWESKELFSDVEDIVNKSVEEFNSIDDGVFVKWSVFKVSNSIDFEFYVKE